MPASNKESGARPRRLEMLAPVGFPMVRPGEPLLPLILENLRENDLPLRDGDILVVTQKILSKSENRYVAFADVSLAGRSRNQSRVRSAGCAPDWS